MITTTPSPRFFLYPLKKNLPRIAGLFGLLLILSGCQSGPPPEKVTREFWEAMARGDIETAKKHTTQISQYLVTPQQNLEDAAVQTGAVQTDGGNAKVATILTLKKPENNKKVHTFDTVLAEEDDRWKVDYLQTMNNFLHLPFGEIFKSLQGIGEAINRDLQQQLPLFEKQLRSFSDELLRQMEEFRRQLEKSVPPEPPRRDRTI
jgi:hypothetical protein